MAEPQSIFKELQLPLILLAIVIIITIGLVIFMVLTKSLIFYFSVKSLVSADGFNNLAHARCQ